MKTYFVICFTSILLFISMQLSANNTYIIYMDSVNMGDTIYTCESYDSIKIVPMSDYVLGVWWNAAGNLPPGYDYRGWPDTLNIYLPSYFNGQVNCEGTDGVNYLQKTIEIRTTFLIAQDKTGSCGAQIQLNAITNYIGKSNIIYSWEPINELSDHTIPNPTLKLTKDMAFTVTINTPNGCTLTENLNVTLQPAASPSICMVSVDSTNRNIIYWEKPFSAIIDSFYVYKETNVTSVYIRIGVTGPDKSFFIDSTSFPFIQSNKYRISLKDSCFLESEKSIAHKTIHLTINQGMNNSWNLIWEPYEGFEISTYYIYRGTNSKNLQLIGTTSGSSNQYTDFNAPTGYVFYQIEVVSPSECNISGLKSTQLSINTSRSNIATNSPTGINDIQNELSLYSIYPNPFNNKLCIDLKLNEVKNGIIEISDLTGKRIVSNDLKSSEIEINTNSLYNGLYILRIKTNDKIITEKIIKN